MLYKDTARQRVQRNTVVSEINRGRFFGRRLRARTAADPGVPSRPEAWQVARGHKPTGDAGLDPQTPSEHNDQGPASV
jgi:hypothetical protein